MNDQYVTPLEVAKQMRIHPQTIRRLAITGHIPGAVRIGRAIRIPAEYVKNSAILFQKEHPEEKEGKQE